MVSTTPKFDRNLSRKGAVAALSLITLLLVAVLAGCAPSEPTAAADTPTANQELNLSFDHLPSGFAPIENSATSIRLAPKEAGDPLAEMWVEVGERSDFGIQLTDIVSAQKEAFLALPEGSFNGNKPLQTPAGRAYYSRGRYQYKGVQVEETRVFQIHPSENRLVTFHYRYPAGEDSAERIGTLFEWLGEMTDAGHPQTEPSATDQGPSD